MNRSTSWLCFGLVASAISMAPARAGGIAGNMYNLPPRKDQILPNVIVTIRVTQFTELDQIGGTSRGPDLTPTKLDGTAFRVLPAGGRIAFLPRETAVISNAGRVTRLHVIGGRFEFKVPSGTGGNQAVTIDFSRSGRDSNGNLIPEAITQTLYGVVIENDPPSGGAPKILDADVTVPEAKAPAAPVCPPAQYVYYARPARHHQHHGLLGHHRR